MRTRAKIVTLMVVLAVSQVCSIPSVAADKPKRVVSLNLCTDQLVLQLAPRENVASVTYLARDPAVSHVAGLTKGLHINHGLAEEVLPLEPDLVLAGSYTTRSTTHLLRRFGVPVMVIEPAQSLGEAVSIILRVADALGVRDNGEAAAAKISNAARSRTAAYTPTAVVLRPNGFTVGKGSLADDIMTAAGFINLSSQIGMGGFGFVALEQIVAARPDFVIVGPRRGTPSLSEIYLRHPALTPVSDTAGRIEMPAHLWNCAGPQIADAVALLSGVLKDLDNGGRE